VHKGRPIVEAEPRRLLGEIDVERRAGEQRRHDQRQQTEDHG
jgi:hypothetical protein